MADIAKAFISIHTPQIEHRVENINALSLSEAIKIISKNPNKYIFHNNWLFDFEKKIYIFSYKNKKLILKKGNINKLKKEIEASLKQRQKTNKIKIKNKQERYGQYRDRSLADLTNWTDTLSPKAVVLS